jgi:hypothetical protein
MGRSELSYAHARRSLRRARLLLVFAGGVLPATALGQSVSPPIAEYQEHARSSFQLSNQSIFPLTVVLEVKGFRVTERGEVQDAPFDSARIHLKLSAMSFRIPPRGTYTVFYEASADGAPAWFNILSAMSGARTDAGVNVRILLPHVVYLNQKQPLRMEEVAVRAFELDSAAKVARVQLENTGANLGRVLQVTVASGKTQSPPGSAFPLFPHSRRWTEVPWSHDSIPDRLQIRFAKFTIDTALISTLVTAARDTAVSDSTGR